MAQYHSQSLSHSPVWSFKDAGLGSILPILEIGKQSHEKLSAFWATKLLNADTQGICLVFLSTKFQQYRKVTTRKSCLQAGYVLVGGLEFLSYGKIRHQCKTYWFNCPKSVAPSVNTGTAGRGVPSGRLRGAHPRAPVGEQALDKQRGRNRSAAGAVGTVDAVQVRRAGQGHGGPRCGKGCLEAWGTVEVLLAVGQRPCVVMTGPPPGAPSPQHP